MQMKINAYTNIIVYINKSTCKYTHTHRAAFSGHFIRHTNSTPGTIRFCFYNKPNSFEAWFREKCRKQGFWSKIALCTPLVHWAALLHFPSALASLAAILRLLTLLCGKTQEDGRLRWWIHHVWPQHPHHAQNRSDQVSWPLECLAEVFHPVCMLYTTLRFSHMIHCLDEWPVCIN